MTDEYTTAVRTALGALLALGAMMLAVASVLHFGAAIQIGGTRLQDPFSGAAIPEAILAAALALGAASVLARLAGAWAVALGTTLFGVLGVGFGLSLTAGGPRTGDVAYHVSLLVALLVAVGLLLAPPGRRALVRAR
jgi:hypothetical protein